MQSGSCAQERQFVASAAALGFRDRVKWTSDPVEEMWVGR